MSDKRTINNLLMDELKELYAAEEQLTITIPKMVKGAVDPVLKEALSVHLQETRVQVARLEEVGRLLGIKVHGVECSDLKDVVKEGADIIGRQEGHSAFDRGLIEVGSRLENYEIAAYMTAMFLAEEMEAMNVVHLLRQTLSEEISIESKLWNIGSRLSKAA